MSQSRIRIFQGAKIYRYYLLESIKAYNSTLSFIRLFTKIICKLLSGRDIMMQINQRMEFCYENEEFYAGDFIVCR